tara:strand:+ start:13446 stop:13967 length:522 start_codon:yes stop_codon:yes gene_type:complete
MIKRKATHRLKKYVADLTGSRVTKAKKRVEANEIAYRKSDRDFVRLHNYHDRLKESGRPDKHLKSIKRASERAGLAANASLERGSRLEGKLYRVKRDRNKARVNTLVALTAGGISLGALVKGSKMLKGSKKGVVVASKKNRLLKALKKNKGKAIAGGAGAAGLTSLLAGNKKK